MILRYSATHRTEHDKVYRLDAVDAYNQKLVKKIAVRGVTTRGLVARTPTLSRDDRSLEGPSRRKRGRRWKSATTRELSGTSQSPSRSDNLFDLSEGLEQYRGFVVGDMTPR